MISRSQHRFPCFARFGNIIFHRVGIEIEQGTAHVKVADKDFTNVFCVWTQMRFFRVPFT